MTRKRPVKFYSSSGWVIRLRKSDVSDLGLTDNCLVDIDDITIYKKRKQNE